MLKKGRPSDGVTYMLFNVFFQIVCKYFNKVQYFCYFYYVNNYSNTKVLKRSTKTIYLSKTISFFRNIAFNLPLLAGKINCSG